jgi:hypothetical protein
MPGGRPPLIAMRIVRPVKGRVRFKIDDPPFPIAPVVVHALRELGIRCEYDGAAGVFRVSRGRYMNLVRWARGVRWIMSVVAWEKYDEATICTASCQNAESDRWGCVCSCGGEGHGGGKSTDDYFVLSRDKGVTRVRWK